MDVLADLDGRGGRISDSFVALLNKLIGLSVRDPMLREVAETKLTSIGLPRGITLLEPSRVRATLEEMLQRRDDKDFTPDDYKEALAGLGSVPSSSPRRLSRYDDVASPEAVTAHVSAIVLRLLVALPDHPDAPAYLRRLIAEAPRALEAGRFPELLEVATSLRDLLVLRLYVPEETIHLTESYLAQLRQPAAVTRILEAIELSPSPTPRELVGLIRLGGTDAAIETLERFAGLPEGESRGRLRSLLTQAKPEVFAEVVARARSTGGPLLRALLALLAHPDTPGRVEVALTLLSTRDAAVRREAFAVVIDGDERPGQRERHLQRALTDASHEVRTFAIEIARRRGGDTAVTALRAFLLSSTVSEGGAGESAVSALAEIATPAAWATLAELLRRSHTRILRREVRVCRAAADALRGVEDPAIASEVRAWRRSLSGWMAWLLGQGAEREDT
jgi:hypothetical protein